MEEIIKKIFNRQRDYYKTGITKSLDFRKAALSRLKQSIINNELQIVEALKQDLGKPPMEVYTAEIGSLISEINKISKNLKKWTANQKVKGSLLDFPSKGYITMEPYGTVLIIGPWNYPFELTLNPLVGAIASGNTAILKPSEISCESSRIISKIISEVFDDQYISVIEGGLDAVQILQELSFDKIFFTGSPVVGTLIMKKAAEFLTPVTLELGGKNPCIIDKDVNIELTVKRLIFGKFMNNGQTCIAPDYLFVHSSVKEIFLESIKRNIIQFWGHNIKKRSDIFLL